MLASGRLFMSRVCRTLARATIRISRRRSAGGRAADGRQSPTYPPGLPLLMAIPHALAGITGASRW